MRPIRIHDTLTGNLLPLEPREGNKVGIYACGPTVYGRIHVGNARPFVVFGIFKRFLDSVGYDAKLVANLTDVNDKIYAAANAAGVASTDLANQMADHYRADTDALQIGRPDAEPLATGHIDEIISLIADLVDAGHAYEAEGDVYFSVRSHKAYGELSHRDVDQMDQGEGVQGASIKRDALDFALWKANKPGEDTSWDSPWGPGRPGWHIECSAMAEAELGVDFEVHGGGSDLVFPHHENEQAQTAAARGKPLAKIWMHNGMVRFGEEKMAKSVGNVLLLHEAIEAHGRDAVLLWLLSGHYRQPLSCTDERFVEAQARAARIGELARNLTDGPSPDSLTPYAERFFDSLADDFNTPAALAELFGWVREANRDGEVIGGDGLRAMLSVFALENLLDQTAGDGPDAEALELLTARETARAASDWAEADRIRDELLQRGWTVRDGANGPELISDQ
ncbi:MAG: cysteine--tRNA ligase [Actinobacteria bacterium]|uniref:Cysteine--tRNA ligase n=1 Tax=freshwater metagenome TaxID=449393 RepID=A0A6J7E905_9ZZZZ|nr:cysteine--tRNA ligase [Actinomycetota bacterium]